MTDHGTTSKSYCKWCGILQSILARFCTDLYNNDFGYIAGQNFKYCGLNDESYNISYLNYENYGDYARMDLGTILNAGMALYIYLYMYMYMPQKCC